MNAKIWIICAAAVIAAAISAQSISAQQIKAQRIGSRIDVSIGSSFFTSYVTSPDEKYPYFFPVNAPATGGSITSMRNAEYPHHSSLFFGCDRVNGGNYWQEGLERGQIISTGARIEEQGARVVISDRCIWQRRGAASPVHDMRRIVISAPSASLWQIDFEITLTAQMPIEVLKTNHSLFSVRTAADISVKNGGVMLDSEGRRGEKETFGKTAAWIDYYGQRGDAVEGIALLQHPSNAAYPSPWFTRDYGFISPTPMYWPPAGAESIRLAEGDCITLRYRVLVHAGSCADADIAGQFAAFSRQN